MKGGVVIVIATGIGMPVFWELFKYSFGKGHTNAISSADHHSIVDKKVN
ncbi:hypothetical protein HPT25_26210 [Bacillus sp. BRMEA1]|nr:hypothetical protein [Neobacillus endophyticus]NRD80825.1 hypothetical protein [Neobacillus endophyticus]